MKRLASSAGFGLVEAAVTLVVLGLIGTIFTSSAESARRIANEASVRSALIEIEIAQTQFASLDLDSNGVEDFAETLLRLRAAHLEPPLALGTSHGYIFDLRTSPDRLQFIVVAAPAVPGVTGESCFSVDNLYDLRSHGSNCGCEDTERPVFHFVPDAGADEDAWTLSCVARQRPALVDTEVDLTLTPRPAGQTAAVVALDSVQLLSSGLALQTANTFSPQTRAALEEQLSKLLDANLDGRIQFEEMLTADLFPIVRTAAGGLPNQEPGKAGDDEALREVLKRFQTQLARELRLGAAAEKSTASAPIAPLNDDPGYLHFAAARLDAAAVDVVQGLIDLLDPALQQGDLIGDHLTTTTSRKHALQDDAEALRGRLRAGDTTGLLRDLRAMRELVDGIAKPPDWVRGAAAAQIRQAIDTSIALAQQ